MNAPVENPHTFADAITRSIVGNTRPGSVPGASDKGQGVMTLHEEIERAVQSAIDDGAVVGEFAASASMIASYAMTSLGLWLASHDAGVRDDALRQFAAYRHLPEPVREYLTAYMETGSDIRLGRSEAS